MECIRGKLRYDLSRGDLERIVACYEHTVVDIGTGDGRFVEAIARKNPERLAVGLDSCRENLRVRSRRAPDNALFIIANVDLMPGELGRLAEHVTINFPWGSLLGGLLRADGPVWDGIRLVLKGNGRLTLRVNADGLVQEGLDIDEGERLLAAALRSSCFAVSEIRRLDRDDLARLTTTWSKRLAFGRNPRAAEISATLRPVVEPSRWEIHGPRFSEAPRVRADLVALTVPEFMPRGPPRHVAAHRGRAMDGEPRTENREPRTGNWERGTATGPGTISGVPGFSDHRHGA